jgi:hypothetical protein
VPHCRVMLPINFARPKGRSSVTAHTGREADYSHIIVYDFGSTIIFSQEGVHKCIPKGFPKYVLKSRES